MVSFHDPYVLPFRNKARRYGRAILVVVALLILLTESVYIVGTDSEGLIYTLGRDTAIVGPGLHLKAPFIQKVHIHPTLRAQRVEIGFRTVRSGDRDRPAEYTDAPDEALMLTGDENIVWAEAAVQWRISDIRAFDKNIIDAPSTVRKAAQAVLRKAVGSRNLDPILTTDRTALGIEIQEEMQKILDSYNSGIRILAVQMQDIQPPDPVAGDFKAVVDARETRQRLINEAQRYANQRLPEAQAEADKMLQEAEAYRVRRIEEARGQVARFTELLEEYRRAPEVTRTRLFLEMAQTVLPRVQKIVVVDDSGGILQHLPLGGDTK